MITIVRPTRQTHFISAEVFEKLFSDHLGALFNVRLEPLIPWCQDILGPSDSPYTFQEAVQKFATNTQACDYFCPAYECMQLSPLFMALRNHSRANVRLLLIAHAPGAYIMEWVLLRPLLVPGDLIIAPSQSAKNLIEWLCPELAPFIRIIHHPIPMLPAVPATQPSQTPRIVTLSRITETKLIHRQIEAMAILRARGYDNLRMEIAGSLNVDDDPSKDITQYARSLKAKITRLGLERNVVLVGPIRGEHQKAMFLAGAAVSINLSLSTEEAFPKASVEPLGLGIPVVATRWDGFVETVGNAGNLVPIVEAADGVLDVEAHDVADALEEVLAAPPSAETCMTQANQFRPAVIADKYRSVLQENMEQYDPSQHIITDTLFEYDKSASASQGILGNVAILNSLSWQELMQYHIEFSQKIRQRWEGKTIQGPCQGEILVKLLWFSTKTPIEYLYAGHDVSKWIKTSGQNALLGYNDLNFVERIAKAVQTNAMRSSKMACLLSLSKGKQAHWLEESIRYLEKNNECQSLAYYQIELEYLKGNYSAAYHLFSERYLVGVIPEHEVEALQQLAKICRAWKRPELPLSWLRTWLQKYPDSPGSGMVWLDYSVNASYAGVQYLAEAQEAISVAETLLGNIPVIQKLKQYILVETLLT
jgi:glycosyltransferase involved in cell wall biosynthesis